MERLKARAIQVARRAGKGAAALALHYSGAREFLSAVQRRAVGGRRVLILSYHRVVKDFDEEEKRSLFSLNIEQQTFRRHLEVLQESHDIVSLEDALTVLNGTRQAARDVATITFDDGYRDVYAHAFPVMRDLRVPGVIYVPSGFAGTERRLGHDRLFAALRRMRERGLGPMAVGVGNPGERWLIDVLGGNPPLEVALERLIARYPTPGLLRLADALEDRLDLACHRPPEGELPLSWEMLREMDAYGILTGAHTAEHTVLTHQRLDDARREIAQCKAVLERGVRKPVRHFAYCNGYYSAGVAQALKAEGFVSAVTTEDMPNAPGIDPFALKRKVLWEASSAGILGFYSKALIACQFENTLGMLALQRPVMGARPTNFGSSGRPEDEQGISAHG
ncbi:MAG TPA: polysaccharide deacetylase family protein [Myxococcales bacterium]|nr:polysaccharide deacetylase family protein [Myxococcales bacterium]